MKRDSKILRFSLRERTFINTQTIGTNTWSGQTFQVSVNPWDALVKTKTVAGNSPYAPIVQTISCFQRFKHIGTKIAIVPAAGRPSVDPAHISTATGTQNYVNPYDIANHWCVRKWIGDDFRIPMIAPNMSNLPESARQLDALFLSDNNWRKLGMSQGWSAFIKPLKCSVDITGYGLMAYGQHPNHTGHQTRLNSLAGMAYPSVEVEGEARSPEEQFADEFDPLTPSRRYRPRGWIPNPFAGFKWGNFGASGDLIGTLAPAGVYTNFPWFADGEYPNGVQDFTTDATTINAYISMVRGLLMCPCCLVHIPPAYATQFYWTVYMRHYFAVADPILTTGSWVAAHWYNYNTGESLPVQALSAGTDEFDVLPNVYQSNTLDMHEEKPEEDDSINVDEQPGL